MTKDLADEILQRLIDSYPCKDCTKFKKYVTEVRGFWKFTGGARLESDDEIINRIQNRFMQHMQAKHLPSDKEWGVLRK